MVKILKGLLAILLFLTSYTLGNTAQALPVSPVQLSPADNSAVFSSRLEWQTPSYELYSSNPYRVQVDTEENFAAPISKDYTTDNTFYTPLLAPGIYYWRIKAKDSSSSWSDWSDVWKFTLTEVTPTIASSPSPTLIDPSPTSAPDSPTPSSSSSFRISSVPAVAEISQSFSVKVEISGWAENSHYYLKGAFVKEGSANYFGKTKAEGNWIANNQSYAQQQSITTNSAGNWNGSLEISGDSEDSGFTGSGDYLFKVGRYSSGGSGPVWSNSIIIFLNTSNPINPSPTITKIPPRNSPTVSNSKTSPPAARIPESIIAGPASIAGIAVIPTPAPSPEAIGNSNGPLLTGVTMVILSLALFLRLYIYPWLKGRFGLFR